MANIYCGFLLLPLLLTAVIKVRLSFFHKAIFAFAFICLLAAVGKYFYVRTLLYNFLPGLNMLRHAAIFRVFTMLGFIFIAATGFGWVINAVKQKTDTGFIKAVFANYFLLLLIIFFIALYKSGGHLSFPLLFSTSSVAAFNAQQSAYTHITAQLVFQLCLLLAFIVALFLQSLPGNTRVALISCIVVAEIFISVQLNIPATVVSNVSPAVLQHKLNKLSNGFPVPPLSPMDSFTHYGNGSTLPIWYNISFFKKTPAKDGFNSFYLQSVDDLNASAKLDSFLKLPVVFFNRADTKFEIAKFEPGNIIVHCRTQTTDVINLQQNFYGGWKVFIDGKKEMPEHELCSMYASVPAGEHTIQFRYQQKKVEYMFLLSALSALLVIGFLLRAKLWNGA